MEEFGGCVRARGLIGIRDLEDFATARKIEYFELHRVMRGGGPVTSGAQG